MDALVDRFTRNETKVDPSARDGFSRLGLARYGWNFAFLPPMNTHYMPIERLDRITIFLLGGTLQFASRKILATERTDET